MGGGNEVVALCGITFLVGRRSKFFYYLLAFTFDKGITNCFKMFYHMPRPYMSDSNVKAIVCSKEFGNPSGHSVSSSMITILLILDMFHSRNFKEISNNKNK